MIKHAPLAARPNTTTVVAEHLEQLSADTWRIIAERPVIPETIKEPWSFTVGIEPRLKVFEKLRDMGAIVTTQRRDMTDRGPYFTLLAKIAVTHAHRWTKLLHRELNRRA